MPRARPASASAYLSSRDLGPMFILGCKVSSSVPCSSGEGGCRGVTAAASLLVSPQKQVPTARIKAMKYVLSGTAIAAALVIAAPVWAAPMTPSPSAPSATSAPMGSTGSHMRSHRVKARHHHATQRGSARASDNMANQLNAQELARNAGGGMGGAPAPAYGGPRNPYGQPNQIYGIPGAGQPSASGPTP